MFEFPQALTFLSAEILFVLVRSADLFVAIKSQAQRTKKEQHQIDRGLRRSLLFEALLLVPSSAVLVLLIAPLALPGQWPSGTAN